MPTQQTRSITSTLTEELEVHEQWTDDYRTAENEAFFETAFDRITKLVAAPADASILDAGCGNGRHSARLAKRGFQVTAVDFSDSILSAAASHLHREGCEERVTLKREDLLNLSFPDASFDNALCWGVLMHVHEAELAARNIGRVVKPGGRFVISEGNMHSWQARGFEALRRLTNKGDAVKVSGKLGMEYWTETTAGKLLTREANIPHLIEVLDENGFTLEHRIPGQLTEAYTRMPQGVTRSATHWLNRIWFNYVRWAGPAFGNVLIFRKR